MFLWIKAFFLNYIQALRICMLHFVKKRKGTSFYTCQKASLTIEAAVVVPIMVGFLACILFLFRILQVQVLIEETLMYVGRELSVESCILDSKEAMFLTAEGHLLEVLSQNEIVEKYVAHGKYGIYLGKSDFGDKDIVLCAEYDIKLPVKFFELETIHLSSANRFRKWNGSNSLEETEEYVYVTSTGKAFHRELNCRVLDLSISMVDESEIQKIRGFDGQKYYLCGKCKAYENADKTVYYTNYGTRYHRDISCSVLKRSIKKILVSEIGDRSACSFCYP